MPGSQQPALAETGTIAGTTLDALDGEATIVRGSPALLAQRAVVLAAIGRSAESRAELAAVEKEARNSADTDLGRSWVLYTARTHLRKGDYATAVKMADALVAELPVSPLLAEALAVRGLAQSYTGRHDDARREFERAAELTSNTRMRERLLERAAGCKGAE